MITQPVTPGSHAAPEAHWSDTSPNFQNCLLLMLTVKKCDYNYRSNPLVFSVQISSLSFLFNTLSISKTFYMGNYHAHPSSRERGLTLHTGLNSFFSITKHAKSTLRWQLSNHHLYQHQMLHLGNILLINNEGMDSYR